MLYLGAGAREVKVDDHRSMQVFPDFSDKYQYYYLPNFPRVALMEGGTPAIRLLIFREDLDTIPAGAEEAVGFLSLDVDLRWDPELVENARAKLRAEEQLDQKPRLTPIFFREGSVKLMLLDAVTPEPEAGRPPTEQPTQFVTKIMGAGSPSLYGDNRAIFQASLSKKGAIALSAALDGVTPIGVVYSLTFAGLQPAFNIRAKVEWEKVMDHFSEQKHLDLLFYERDIQKSIDKLVENKVIEVESTIEGIGAEAMDSEREQVMASVRQLIFDKFFEATFKRETAAGDSTADDVVDTLTHIHQNALTLGVGYTYKRKEVRVEELRTLNLDWTARRGAERTIYPQAHMHNLLTGSGITREQLVTVVDGSEAIWKNQPFEVHTTANWEADGIAGISVDIEYDDPQSGNERHWSAFLEKAKDSATHRDWMDRTSGNSFRYKYEVVFLDTDVPGPRPKVNSGEWREHEGTALVIHPRELYESVELEVAAIPKFPFDRWPAVQAILRYRTLDGSFEHYEDGVLKDGADSFTTRFRIDKGVPGRREVLLRYVGASGEREETGWMPMPQDQWVVEDPHDDKLVIRAVVAGKRENILNLLVNLEYVDEENDIHESGSLQFASENINQPLSWTVHLADPAKRRYRYRMTLITADGDFLQTGWIGTDAPTLPVGEVYVRRLTVEVAVGQLGRNIEAVEVDLVYDDDGNDLHETKTFRLTSNGRAEWQVQLKDAGQRSYQSTITWFRTDGFNKKLGPTSHTSTYLAISGSPPENL
ncbi:MAG: hypothetical protein R3B74_00435 [Nitrospirales bacterium]|nr:hypothetical protein [Nitrospirales bacterium]